MLGFFAFLALSAAQPVEVDYCSLKEYWVVMPVNDGRKVPDELREDLMRFIQSGWRGKYQVSITIEDGKIRDAEVISSDPGGPDDAAKVAAVAILSGHYQPADSNPDRIPVRVVMPAGGVPAKVASEAACPTS